MPKKLQKLTLIKKRFKLPKRLPRVTNKQIAIAASLLVIAILGGGGAAHATERTLQTKLLGNQIQPVKTPLTISFNQDLKVKNATVTITPKADVTTSFSGGEFGQTVLTITPVQPLDRNQHYRISIEGLQRLVSQRPLPIQTISFRTELAPGIASFSPTEEGVTRDVRFAMTIADPRLKNQKYRLKLEPKADLVTSFDGQATWTWQPKDALRQGQTYEVFLFKDNKVIQKTTLKVFGEPRIVKATAKDYFYPNERITVEFDKSMRTEQTDKIHFGMPGSGKWENHNTYVFTPSKLEPNKAYDYTFKTGLQSKEGGVVEADKKYTIKTPGPTKVIGTSPHGSERSKKSHIRLTFDQPVDKASAQKHFSITPGVDGNFRWEGNTLVFAPASLASQTTYTISMHAGVAATYGVPSVSATTFRFSTEVETKRLAVPAYRQSHPLSCEASALRMVLAYHGIHSDDMTITQRMGYSPRPLTNGEWDDPYSQFVGDINGKQWNNTGYGAYAPPVAKAARSFGRNATAHSGVSAQFLAEHIHNNRPVVIWGYQYTPTRFSWRTPGGRDVQAWQGEHTRTVIGVKGSASAPVGFYVTDPAYGSTSYYTTGQLMANMNVHGGLSNQAVVVY